MELLYLEEHLSILHSKYYEAYDAKSNKSEVPDVGEVLDNLKAEVLRGTKIVLSGLIPLGVEVHRSEIGMQVLSYGADLRTRIDPDVTHLVISSSRPRTQKVRQAARIPTIRIVNQNWLQDSISKWEEQDETPYLVELSLPMGGPQGVPRVSIPDSTYVAEAAPLENGDENVVDDSDEDTDDPLAGHTSPIDDLKNFDFDAVDEELEEFLGDASDSSDEDRERAALDTDGESDNESTKSDNTANGSIVPLSPGKRKYDGEDGDILPASGNSLLNKKLKISRSRGGSALKNGGPAAADDGEEEVMLLKGDGSDDAENEGEGNNDASFDDFEADLMAELDREEQEGAALADNG